MNRRKFLVGIGAASLAGPIEVAAPFDAEAEALAARRYYHGRNWTVEEIAVLARRGQPIIHYREGRVA